MAAFDVVLDSLCGQPMLTSLKATNWGRTDHDHWHGSRPPAQSGYCRSVVSQSVVHRTGQRPPADREQIWLRLLKIAKEQQIQVDYLDFTLDQAAEAWAAQVNGPHAKITATIRR